MMIICLLIVRRMRKIKKIMKKKKVTIANTKKEKEEEAAALEQQDQQQQNSIDDDTNSSNPTMKINIAAVQSAMKNMRLKNPMLSAKLDAKLQQRTQAQQNDANDIDNAIPASITKIFLNDECNDPDDAINSSNINQTVVLSRSATLMAAMERIFPVSKCSSTSSTTTLTKAKLPNKHVRIHIIGCDHVECSSKETMQELFMPFIQWMYMYYNCNRGGGEGVVELMDLELIGPGVPTKVSKVHSLDRSPIEVVVEPSNADSSSNHRTPSPQALRTRISCTTDTYEDYLTRRNDNASGRKQQHIMPTLIIAFNAGIWGYNSWLPTISHIASLRQAVPFVVTAYTKLEAEEDEDVILNHLQCLELGGALLWEPEVNFYRCRKQRETKSAVAGRVYNENGAWQCWNLGGSCVSLKH
uniref:Mitochondrial splicing suppressor 51-like C-terminal domain-containing protein n=1 Tax=Leptocylindrus danicus TaxID=163516 RepID=A0A7S2K002_9STRA|mmetsp:Transcript_15190/g.22427  ORF Transcript_15190/g.22427 Transcript_15190/m.22427 type:complete len:413 (+) Transcript_15190:365-1603(+)